MLTKVSLILAAATLLSAERLPMLEQRIIFGEDTTIEKNPWQVSLLKKGRHDCGGSIYSRDFIITAAHCVDDIKANKLQVRVGSTNRDQGGTVHQVAAILYHGGYSRATYGTNDIAVLRLSESLIFTDRVRSIPLAAKEPKAGTAAKVTGWGWSLKGSRHAHLQGLEVSIISKWLCKLEHFRIRISDDIICAGVRGKSIAPGDSGSALTVNNELVGVVSSGSIYATAGLYASVVHFRDWIEEATKLLS